MNLTLIPVVEIFFNNETIPTPKGNIWNNSEDWKAYHQKCQTEVGILNPLTPIIKGSSSLITLKV